MGGGPANGYDLDSIICVPNKVQSHGSAAAATSKVAGRPMVEEKAAGGGPARWNDLESNWPGTGFVNNESSFSEKSSRAMGTTPCDGLTRRDKVHWTTGPPKVKGSTSGALLAGDEGLAHSESPSSCAELAWSANWAVSARP